MRRSLTTALLFAALALAGCVTPARFAPGEPLGAVLARLGPPTGQWTTPGMGPVLEYATGPFGKTTWMLQFDDQQRLLRAEQVLNENNFGAILAGMSAEEVRHRIGPPATRFRVARPPQTVWAYRYDPPFCQWFMVGMGDDGHVMDTAYGPDPACEVNGDLMSMGGRRR